QLAVLDPEAYVRVRLSGRPSMPAAGLVADLEEKFAERYFGFEVVLERLEPVKIEARGGTVAEAFLRRMAERAAEAEGGGAEILRLAADYGLMALEGRPLP
ncbi:MAG: hypothetical protein K6U03_11505, partial [Firmicutes bacterium]|nr:hypothetical protein [Bacillota bacterium]